MSSFKGSNNKTNKVNKGTKRGFEVVSSDSAAVKPPPTSNKKQKVGVNSLRNAHANSLVSKQDKKISELWFRKAGYGPILFEAYYKGQSEGIVVREVADESIPDAPSSSTPLLPAGLSKGAKKKLKKKIAKTMEAVAATATTGEFGSFMAALSRPLPLAFRVRLTVASSDFAAVQHTLSTLSLCAPAYFDPAFSQRIYQCDPSVHKSSIGKSGPLHDHPLSSYIASATNSGVLARQEVVSMLPVIALNPSSSDVCLDLCASPGSKTMQCLERLLTGSIVANDIHPQRLAALKDAVLRASLPTETASRLLTSNYDGSKFPLPSSSSLLFDKVMADVPCSGDGTIRKDKTIMPRWNPSISNALHPLQVKIGYRGLELLKVGGIMCYSTCTFNPMENEAVVQELLLKCKEETGHSDAVELIQWSSEVLPGLVRRPGCFDWKVADYVEPKDADDEDGDTDVKLRWWDSFEEAQAGGMTGAVDTLWPNSEKNKDLNLHYCNRLVPQDRQDTGGFFVALLRKNRPLRSQLAMSKDSSKEGEPEEVYKMLHHRRKTGLKVKAK